jgi:hypothetical protein
MEESEASLRSRTLLGFVSLLAWAVLLARTGPEDVLIAGVVFDDLLYAFGIYVARVERAIAPLPAG